jgi:hypothetical protein
MASRYPRKGGGDKKAIRLATSRTEGFPQYLKRRDVHGRYYCIKSDQKSVRYTRESDNMEEATMVGFWTKKDIGAA